ncbi:MAG: hypothetical protein K5894_08795, partial [Lachnospiraceae bacterium]|nr:hypothetical protein [Lachnospiraceae bacterium]
MKNGISVIMAIIMAVSLSACGNNTATGDNSSTGDSAEKEAVSSSAEAAAETTEGISYEEAQSMTADEILENMTMEQKLSQMITFVVRFYGEDE